MARALAIEPVGEVEGPVLAKTPTGFDITCTRFSGATKGVGKALEGGREGGIEGGREIVWEGPWDGMFLDELRLWLCVGMPGRQTNLNVNCSCVATHVRFDLLWRDDGSTEQVSFIAHRGDVLFANEFGCKMGSSCCYDKTTRQKPATLKLNGSSTQQDAIAVTGAEAYAPLRELCA